MSDHHYTRGPWKCGQVSWNENGEVQYTLHGIKEAKLADIKLIETAPDLYEALSEITLDYMGRGYDDHKVVIKARAALAKARGEA